jgi:hypothetical protein
MSWAQSGFAMMVTSHYLVLGGVVGQLEHKWDLHGCLEVAKDSNVRASQRIFVAYVENRKR